MSVIKYQKYEPSKLIVEWRDSGKLLRMRGLCSLMAEAANAGVEVFIDLGDDIPDFYQINATNVRMACNEVDEAQLQFKKGDKYAGMLVIAGNGDDWLCDYHTAPWLEEIIQKAKLD